MRIRTWRTDQASALRRQLEEFERQVEQFRLSAHTRLAELENGLWPDDVFRVVDNVDASKRLAFEVGNVGSGFTRTLEVANADMDLSGGQSELVEDFLSRPIATAVTATNTQVGSGMFIQASSGTLATLLTAADDQHPGIVRLGLPATIGAASGWLTAPHRSNRPGGDFFLFTFRTPSAFANLTVKIGQFAGNTAVTTEPTDGVYLWQTAGTSTFGFKSADASTRTTGGTTTLTTNTWYTATIAWALNRASVRVTLWNEFGVAVLDYELSTNLPPSAGGTMLYAQACVSTSAASAVAQALDLDEVRVRLGGRTSKLGRMRPDLAGQWMRT